MSVRSADNVVTRSHSAKVQASGGVLETTRVSTERLERACEGLLRKGAQAINAYFDANVGGSVPAAVRRRAVHASDSARHHPRALRFHGPTARAQGGCG